MLETVPVATRPLAPTRPRDLPSLTSLRAFAALGVFGYHLTHWHVAVLPGMALGYAGVAFFFVLSGFVLTWGYSGTVSATRFYGRRFARIYPSFLATWLIVFLLPITDEPIRALHAAVNLTLLQAWIPSTSWTFAMNGVCWTLSCEMAFYAAFPWLLRWAVRQPLRRLWQLAAAAFAAEAAVVLLLPQLVHGPLAVQLVTFLPLVRFPEFALGVAAALSLRAGWRLPSVRWLLPLLLACAVGVLLWPTQPNMNIWLTPFFVVLLWFAAHRDTSSGSGVLGNRGLVYAGKVSFAFYLVHELVIINLRHFLGGGWATSAAALVTASVAAVALHHLVELPAHRALVSRMGGRRRVPASDAVSV